MNFWYFFSVWAIFRIIVDKSEKVLWTKKEQIAVFF